MACDDAGPTSPDDDDDDAPVYTETFSGSLNPNGALTFPFTINATGTATATLSSVTPDNTVLLGFAMGVFSSNGTCTAVINNDAALEFAQISGAIGLSSGTLCLRVYDSGRIKTATKFTVNVVHP